MLSDIQPKLLDPSWKIMDILLTRPLQEIAFKCPVQLPCYSARYELFNSNTAVDQRWLLRCCQDLESCNEILRALFVEHEGSSFAVVVADLDAPIVPE